jgi:PAS domain-containing protein
MIDGSETSPGAVRKPDAPRTRAGDFRALAGAALVVLALLALLGQASGLGAVLGVIALVTFALVWFYGTVDPASEATDTSDAQRAARARAEQEKAFRISLVEALPEPALYIDVQGKVEAANAAARRTFRFVGAEPQLTAVVRRPELLDAVAAARQNGEVQRLEFTERGETDRYFA